MIDSHESCRWCSNGATIVYHNGKCPFVKSIELHPNGTIKKVEFFEENLSDQYFINFTLEDGACNPEPPRIHTDPQVSNTSWEGLCP